MTSGDGCRISGYKRDSWGATLQIDGAVSYGSNSDEDGHGKVTSSKAHHFRAFQRELALSAVNMYRKDDARMVRVQENEPVGRPVMTSRGQRVRRKGV